MEMKCRMNIENKKKDKLNQLKVKEWYIIQNELNVLAHRQYEMKKLNKIQKLLKKRIKKKEQGNGQIVLNKFNEENFL